MTPLRQSLEQFRQQSNSHPRIASLIKGWEPTIVVEATDSGSTHYIPVRACRIDSIAEGSNETRHLVHLRAPEAVLTDVFAGRINPATAFLDGALEIFAEDKDHVKLDAISLVLWGA
jgi:hypothetical protein